MTKIDFHTHSVASPDGCITEKEYEEIIAKRILDVVAITDHNRIDFAQNLHKKLGNKIIVGEEIMTADGELIGLFLTDKVTPFQSITKTIKSIHQQGGLVYIPHPFDSLRKGIGKKKFLENLSEIDIIEGFNGRMILPWQNIKAEKFARQYNLVMAASSDAHSIIGLGRTYTEIVGDVTNKTLTSLLMAGKHSLQFQPVMGYIQPFLNRLKHG